MAFQDRAGNPLNILNVGGALQFCVVADEEPTLETSLDLGFDLSAVHLRSIFLAMSEGLVLHAPSGQIIDANSAAEKILGLSRDQLLGKVPMDPDWQAIREDGTPFPGSEHPAMVTLRTGQPIHSQIMGIRTPAADLRWISINSQPLFAAQGAKPSAVVTFIDITLQRQLSDALRLAHEDQRAILDNVPARITSWNADTTLQFLNSVAATHFGVSAEMVVGKRCEDILNPQRYQRFKPHMEIALTGARHSHDQMDVEPDGSERQNHVKYVPKLRDGRVTGFYALATDVTDLSDSYRRVRDLAQRLETIREEERRASAQLLHEGIAQDLFAMKLGLTNLQAQSAGRTGVVQACHELSEAINRCMNATRQIAQGLWPSAIAHLRVSAAIEEHAQHFGEMSGLLIHVTEVAAFPALEETTGLIFFRAAQEALTNVARHAQASRVNIVLRADIDSITMNITDDGIGIEDSSLTKAGCLGLLGLRERVGALGGQLAVCGNTGGGTTVSVQLPRSTGLSD